jgi:hypothetical protein
MRILRAIRRASDALHKTPTRTGWEGNR